jgi:hypothetical protein
MYNLLFAAGWFVVAVLGEEVFRRGTVKSHQHAKAGVQVLGQKYRDWRGRRLARKIGRRVVKEGYKPGGEKT